MIEPLFASGSQIWPGMAAPALGWSQVPVPLGNRGIGGGATGFNSSQIFPVMAPAGMALGHQNSHAGSALPTDVYGVGTAPAAFAQPTLIGSNYGAGGPVVHSPFIGAAFPGFVAPEFASGFSIPALLTAVALRRGQPTGPTNDQEIEDFIYDALELIAGTSEVDVRCEGGRATFAGSVQQKRLKRDIGEIAWSIPGLNDVQNNITIATRRRSRGTGREVESHAGVGGRKQA